MRRVAAALTVLVLGGLVLGGPAPAARADSAGTVFVQTVPALGGVGLAVGAGSVTTDRAGRAALKVEDLNGVASTVRLVHQRLNGTTTLALNRVTPAAHTVAHESHLTVALDLTSAVRLRVKSGNSGVPTSSVQSIRLHSVTGQVLVVDPRSTPTVTLLARRARFRHGVLEAQPVTWSVDHVDAGPGVALTTSKPRFDPLGHSRWTVSLRRVQGTVKISTVPATADVTFQIDGNTATTGSAGTTRVPVDNLNAIGSRLQLDDATAGDQSVSLRRLGKVGTPAPGQRQVVAVLAVRRQVTLHFVDPAGNPVPSHRISSVRLRSDGRILTVSGAQVSAPVALFADTATQVDGAWQSRPIGYSVWSVRLDGGEAVFAGQHRVEADRPQTWTVPLSVFDITVTAHDVLFGRHVSSRMWITRPDGIRLRAELGAGAPTELHSLVRGLYGIDVDARVLGGRTTVLVSRDDNVDLRVVTALDVIVIAAIALLLVVGALVGGRQLTRRRTLRART